MINISIPAFFGIQLFWHPAFLASGFFWHPVFLASGFFWHPALPRCRCHVTLDSRRGKARPEKSSQQGVLHLHPQPIHISLVLRSSTLLPRLGGKVKPRAHQQGQLLRNLKAFVFMSLLALPFANKTRDFGIGWTKFGLKRQGGLELVPVFCH